VIRKRFPPSSSQTPLSIPVCFPARCQNRLWQSGAYFFRVISARGVTIYRSGEYHSLKKQIRQWEPEYAYAKVTIPENLDYEGMLDDLLEKYTNSAEIDRVKTTNMGSLYEISYLVQLKTVAAPKEFLDELCCRNGNLNIICGRQTTNRDEL